MKNKNTLIATAISPASIANNDSDKRRLIKDSILFGMGMACARFNVDIPKDERDFESEIGVNEVIKHTIEHYK